MGSMQIDASNYKQYVKDIAEVRAKWIKTISDSVLTMTERQRKLMGLSIAEYYGNFLGCPMNYRTLRKMLDRETPISLSLLLSFCFTYGHDIKKIEGISELVQSNESFDTYQQIGASIESLGRAGVYQLSEDVMRNCTTANLYNRRRCAETLNALADSMKFNVYDDDTWKTMNNMTEKINEAANKSIEDIKKEVKEKDL